MVQSMQGGCVVYVSLEGQEACNVSNESNTHVVMVPDANKDCPWCGSCASKGHSQRTGSSEATAGRGPEPTIPQLDIGDLQSISALCDFLCMEYPGAAPSGQ